MKKLLFLTILSTILFFSSNTASAQCSICTKTASQLGEGPAKGLNGGIIYLMATPLIIAGYIGFRWWKREKGYLGEEDN